MKIKVKTRRDNDGRLTYLWLKKKRQRKPAELHFQYGVDGFLKSIEFDGRETDLPSIAELVDLLNEKFMERIGTIKLIKNIENIENIDLIAAIATIASIANIVNVESIDVIDEITKIDSIQVLRGLGSKSLILNGGFETGAFEGWAYTLNPSIHSGANVHEGSYSCMIERAAGVSPTITQYLSPIDSDGALFSLWHLTTATKDLKVVIEYSDGTSSSHTNTATGGWDYWLITPTANKYLKSITISCDDTNMTAFVDDIRLTVN